MKPYAVAAVAAVLLAGASRAPANSIVNGGFEDPANAPPGGWVTYFGGQSFPGWVVGGDSVDVHHTGHTTALAGIQSLDLSGNAAGSITQTIATTPGITYTLSFGYAGHVYHPYAGDAFAEIYWDGTLVDTISRPPSPDSVNINWTTGTYTLVATGTSTDLSFVSLSPNGGILLDEITLTAVPEPSALALIASASLVGLVARRMRRRA